MANSVSTGEILHLSYLRMRVAGSGNLQTVLRSLDPNNVNQTLPNIIMANPTNKEPILYSNFMDQRMQVHFFVQNLDEDFVISRIIVWVKPVAFNYPQ